MCLSWIVRVFLIVLNGYFEYIPLQVSVLLFGMLYLTLWYMWMSVRILVRNIDELCLSWIVRVFLNVLNGYFEYITLQVYVLLFGMLYLTLLYMWMSVRIRVHNIDELCFSLIVCVFLIVWMAISNIYHHQYLFYYFECFSSLCICEWV